MTRGTAWSSREEEEEEEGWQQQRIPMDVRG